MNLSSIQVQQTPPVEIAFRFEHGLRGLKCIERLGVSAQLEQGDSQKGRRLGFFIVESDFLEPPGSALR